MLKSVPQDTLLMPKPILASEYMTPEEMVGSSNV